MADIGTDSSLTREQVKDAAASLAIGMCREMRNRLQESAGHLPPACAYDLENVALQIEAQLKEAVRLRAQVTALQAREGRLMAMAVEARRHMASVNEESPAVEAVCVILERMQSRAP